LTWFLKDFDLLSVILRALTLALEAFTLGGVFFLLLVAAPARIANETSSGLRRAASYAALALAVAQAAATGLSVAILVGGSGFPLVQIVSANFFYAGAAEVACSLAIAGLLRGKSYFSVMLSVPLALGLLAASIAMSHAASRLDHRLLLSGLTAAHQLGTAGWIGAMPFLLLAVRQSEPDAAMRVARRYSVLAMVSVPVLLGAGIGLGYFYIGSFAGVYGTSYGVLVMAKTYLLLTMLVLGASNQRLLRRTAASAAAPAAIPVAPNRAPGLLLRLRSFSEAEIALGFTAILAAASLTSQPPAIDIGSPDRLTGHEIIARFCWQTPRLTSPPLASLVPPVSLAAALPQQQFGNGTANDANDRAWSEYNHHWAGLILLAAALLALFSRAGVPPSLQRLARNWPLLFLALAVFILLRADPENWPLGPRPFWASFSRPDVLEHRLYALLIAAFAFFEWAVERGFLRWPGAAYFFPLACGAGGAVLLTHAHALGSMHEEMFAELTHTPIALLGATAGGARWLELRLPGRREARWAGRVWPICLLLAGLVLMDYRES
jgi:putative copper resistance protein D